VIILWLIQGAFIAVGGIIAKILWGKASHNKQAVQAVQAQVDEHEKILKAQSRGA
jgi:hypothetical protein